MRKLFFLPVAAFVFAACSESTAPETNSDLSPSYAKGGVPGKPGDGDGGGGGGGGGGTDVSGTHVHHLWDFNTGVAADNLGGTHSAGLAIYHETSATAIASGPQTIHPPSYPSGNDVLGAPTEDGLGVETLNDERVEITVPAGSKTYFISFELFLIGSWDGRGKQAQQGSFGVDDWRIAYTCPSSPSIGNIFHTTFSNQKTVQQNYPRQITEGGGSPYLTGSDGRDELGFNTHVPSFESAADSRYNLSYTGSNPCGGTSAFTLRISSPDFDLQHDFDESWTMDNILLKTDS